MSGDGGNPLSGAAPLAAMARPARWPPRGIERVTVNTPRAPGRLRNAVVTEFDIIRLRHGVVCISKHEPRRSTLRRNACGTYPLEARIFIDEYDTSPMRFSVIAAQLSAMQPDPTRTREGGTVARSRVRCRLFAIAERRADSSQLALRYTAHPRAHSHAMPPACPAVLAG